MQKKNISIAMVIILVIAGIFLFFSSSSDIKTENNATSSEKETVQSSKPKTTSSKVYSSHVYIDIINNSFSPQVITIKEGTIVTWTNRDSESHTVTADINGPTSNQLGKGQTYSYKYSEAGIYGYHCTLHRNMTGMIIVE